MRGAAAVPAVTLGVSSGYCLIVQLSDNATKGRSMPLEIVPKSPLAPDVPALQAWLAPHWPAAASGLRLSRLAGGQSNPTWLLTPAQGEPRVLRAKPGPQAALLPSAHAIEREFAVLQALQGSEVPVPQVHRFCADESVIGAAFYLMAYVPGRVLRDASLPGMSPAERTALHDEAHRVLAALHRVDWRARGLQDFGRTEASMERLIEWLPAHIPASARDPGALALLHGDFRLENMVFHPSEPRVLAVLDWELATLGHPLSDLAYHAMAWHHPPGPLQGLAGLDLAALGIPTEQAFVARYLARMGRDDLAAVQADWPFYLACNLFRLCAILQGIARRVQDGTAASPIAREVSAQAGAVAERGWGLVSDW